MFVTVNDILKLPVLSNTKLIAGSLGLNKAVYRISVVECPEFPMDIEMMGENNLLFNEGDFFITGFYAVKDAPEKILDTIKLYNQYNCSGVLLSNKYFEELPDEVIEYANEHKYPIIMFDHSIPYSNIIYDVMEMIILQKKDMVDEVIIDQILNNNYNKEEIIDAAYSLNTNFQKHLMCIYYECFDLNLNQIKSLISDMNKESKYFAVKYKEGMLIFVNDKDIIKDKTQIFIDNICGMIGFYTNDYKIGISKAYEGLNNIKFCIKEALIARKVALIQDEKIIFYDNIGTYKLLLEFIDNKVLEDYYNQFFQPIIQYDKEHNTGLMGTIMGYVESDGDIKKTAQKLFQHENTIRYRLVKTRQLLKIEEENIKFYENLAISSKIHNILKRLEKDK